MRSRSCRRGSASAAHCRTELARKPPRPTDRQPSSFTIDHGVAMADDIAQAGDGPAIDGAVRWTGFDLGRATDMDRRSTLRLDCRCRRDRPRESLSPRRGAENYDGGRRIPEDSGRSVPEFLSPRCKIRMPRDMRVQGAVLDSASILAGHSTLGAKRSTKLYGATSLGSRDSAWPGSRRLVPCCMYEHT